MLDLSSKSCTVTGVDVKPPTHYFTGPLTCQFWYAFLIVPQCLLLSLRGSFWVSSGSYSEEPLILTLTKTSQKIHGHILQAVNLSVWDKEIPVKAINAQTVRISLSHKMLNLRGDNIL